MAKSRAKVRAEKQAEFGRRLEHLRRYTAQLSYVLNDTFPEGYVFDPDDPDVSGESLDPPLRPIAESIDNVLGCFDGLQEAMTIPSGAEPRHRRFLSGR